MAYHKVHVPENIFSKRNQKSLFWKGRKQGFLVGVLAGVVMTLILAALIWKVF